MLYCLPEIAAPSFRVSSHILYIKYKAVGDVIALYYYSAQCTVKVRIFDYFFYFRLHQYRLNLSCIYLADLTRSDK